jgi:hypothetical protein
MAKLPKRYNIVYDNGIVKVDFVGRIAKELPKEFERVKLSIVKSIRLLAYLKRSPHPAIKAATFQLENAVRPIDANNMQDIADEIARLSFIMADTVTLLATLSNSEIEQLQRLRFELTYGQTPKKRELEDPICGRKRRLDRDDEYEENRNHED